jgi:hypothetical protein
MVLAWVVPGAGHVYIGRMARGIIIFFVVGATFWAGVAVGGIKTVDPQAERWWFYAQMMTGVHGLAAWQRQRAFPTITWTPQNEPDRRKLNDYLHKYFNAASPDNLGLVSPVDTVARAYSGVAGLLNLLCIFDALLLAWMGVSGEPVQPPPLQDREPPSEERR